MQHNFRQSQITYLYDVADEGTKSQNELVFADGGLILQDVLNAT